MATKKLTELPVQAGALTADEIGVCVEDPAGTPVTKSFTFAQVRNFVLGIAVAGAIIFPEKSLSLRGAAAVTGADPVTVEVRSTTDSVGWTAGAAWGRISFFSDDLSGLGSARRASVDAYAIEATGARTGVKILTSSATALVTAADFGDTAITFSLPTTFTTTLTQNGTTANLVQSATVGVAYFGTGVGSGATNLYIRAAAGQYRQIIYTSGTLARWTFYTDIDAELGSDAGSTLKFGAHNDAGTFLNNWLSVTRSATGPIMFLSTRPITGGTYNGVTLGVTTTFPSTTSFVIGSDPGGGHLFRVGGNGIFTNLFSGTATLSAAGALVFSNAGEITIRTNTSDASDTARIIIAGASASTVTRGAYIVISGNENVSSPGSLILVSGSTGTVQVNGSSMHPTSSGMDFGTPALRWDAYLTTVDVAGTLTLANNLTMVPVAGAATIGTNTADGFDTAELKLTPASAPSGTRGAVIVLYGNEHATTPGRFYMSSGNATAADFIAQIKGIDFISVTRPAATNIIAFTGQASFSDLLTASNNILFPSNGTAIGASTRAFGPSNTSAGLTANVPNGGAFLVTVNGVTAFSQFAATASFPTTTAFTIGSDPGGSHLFRVGGSAVFNSKIDVGLLLNTGFTADRSLIAHSGPYNITPLGTLTLFDRRAQGDKVGPWLVFRGFNDASGTVARSWYAIGGEKNGGTAGSNNGRLAFYSIVDTTVTERGYMDHAGEFNWLYELRVGSASAVAPNTLLVTGPVAVQARFRYDTNNYLDIGVDNGGAITFTGTASGTTSFKFTDGPLNVTSPNGYQINGNKVLGDRKSGWGIPTGTLTRTTYVTSTVTTEQLAERVAALLNDLHAGGAGATHHLLAT